jgi:hypothetical protein
MASGFHLAQAWVSVDADTSELRGQVEAALQAGLRTKSSSLFRGFPVMLL